MTETKKPELVSSMPHSLNSLVFDGEFLGFANHRRDRRFLTTGEDKPSKFGCMEPSDALITGWRLFWWSWKRTGLKHKLRTLFGYTGIAPKLPQWFRLRIGMLG